MSEALQLFDVPSVPKLTDRQQRALDAIKEAGYDGLHTDEVGAIVHPHADDERCAWCGSSGSELGRRLRDLKLVQQRRRKAPNGDTITAWTVAGKLPPPTAERDNGSAFNRDGIPF